jgi:hypothetical protein
LKHKSVPSKEQRKPQRDQARAPTAGWGVSEKKKKKKKIEEKKKTSRLV